MKKLTKDFEGVEIFRGESLPYCVLFHGYGADAHDLFSLHELLDPNEEWNWFFPQGLLNIPLGVHAEGRAWWNIDLARLQTRPGEWNFAAEVPKGLEGASFHGQNILRALENHKVVIGGFSQGAMLTVETVSAHFEALAATQSSPDSQIQGVLLFSGALIARSLLQDRSPKVGKGIPFVQSHGLQDPVLPYLGAKTLHQFLTETYQWQGSLTSFQGGHEIPIKPLNLARALLQEQSKA